MKRVLSIVALVLVSSVLFVGCGKKGLVGSWVHETYSSYVYTFNEDKTCTYSTMECTYEYDEEKGTLSILYKGNTVPFETTYKIDGDKLTIKDSLENDVVYKRQK